MGVKALCCVDRQIPAWLILGSLVLDSQAENVILISIETHINPRFVQMNLIKSLSPVSYIVQKFTRDGERTV